MAKSKQTSNPLLKLTASQVTKLHKTTYSVDRKTKGLLDDMEFQSHCYDTWLEKYALSDPQGNKLETSHAEAKHRAAVALADVDGDSGFYPAYLQMLDYCVLGGRIASNIGAEHIRPGVSLINCVVSGTIEDSLDSILEMQREAALTLKAGCGIGYCFSTLRPNNSFVGGVGAKSSGPVSFMRGYDRYCETISSAGGRRGAQMGTLSVEHPDLYELVLAKRTEGELRSFNLSILITDEFIECLRSRGMWQFRWGGIPYGDPVPAIEVWETIMRSNYEYGEPGILLIDRINRLNNLWWCEDIRATNPCGEQPLPPYGSCLLGSLLLPMFVRDPFTDNAEFDFDLFSHMVRIFTRALDNVVELNGLPLPEQVEEIQQKRRHGMGYTGLGSALTMLGIEYGSDKAVELTWEITRMMAVVGYRTGVELAIEKGAAPILRRVFSHDSLSDADGWSSWKDERVEKLKAYQRQQSKKSKKSPVDYFYGRELFAASEYFACWEHEIDTAQILDAIRVVGCRFTHHGSIAPTGTISIAYGNNCSSGIEPSFNNYFVRNRIVPGSSTKVALYIYSYEFLVYKHLVEKGYITHTNSPDVQEKLKAASKDIHSLDVDFMPYIFDRNTCDRVTPIQHLSMQRAAQKWIDSSISKTINVPTAYTFEEFSTIYSTALDSGVKGCTVFRFNPEHFQGVLVRTSDLASTHYSFTTDLGEVITVTGDTVLEYNGEQCTAANLYDAIKEGYYGRL